MADPSTPTVVKKPRKGRSKKSFKNLGKLISTFYVLVPVGDANVCRPGNVLSEGQITLSEQKTLRLLSKFGLVTIDADGEVQPIL